MRKRLDIAAELERLLPRFEHLLARLEDLLAAAQCKQLLFDEVLAALIAAQEGNARPSTELH